MDYALVRFEDGTMALQEIWRGVVQRYCDGDGNTIHPQGGSAVLDPAVPAPAWAPPDPVEEVFGAPPVVRQLSKLDYMKRFADEELSAIYSAAKVNVMVEIWLEKFRLAEYINLDDPKTQDGVHALEAAGLIAPGRAVEVLA